MSEEDDIVEVSEEAVEEKDLEKEVVKSPRTKSKKAKTPVNRVEEIYQRGLERLDAFYRPPKKKVRSDYNDPEGTVKYGNTHTSGAN